MVIFLSKRSMVLVSRVMILVFLLFAIAGITPVSFKVHAEYGTSVYKFDFGTETSPVAEGYIGVPSTTLYDSTKGYGFDKAAGNRDRGGPDDLRRDFALAGGCTFITDVANGEYFVKIIIGDNIASQKTDVTIEGVSKGRVSTGSGSFAENVYLVNVTDGQLNIAFGSDGRVCGVEIAPPVQVPSGLTIAAKTLLPVASVSLNWQAVNGAADYHVYRMAEWETQFSRIGTSATQDYTDSSVEIGYTYTYKVAAANIIDIESEMSTEVTAAVIDASVQAPSAPLGLAVSDISKESLTIKWNAIDNAVRYTVYKADFTYDEYKKIADTTAPEFTDDSVLTSKHFYYMVTATNLGGTSPKSEILETPITVAFTRQMESLDRGLTAVKTDNGVFISWRMFATDPDSVTFNLYRDGTKVNSEPIATSTNYLDTTGTSSSTYTISVVIDGAEKLQPEKASVWGNNYMSVPLQIPAGGTTPDGVNYTYSANDCSTGDLDGDGEYEIVVKWDPSNSKDNANGGYTGNVYLDAYKLDGTRLWRIDLGKNIRAGAHYTQLMVYDLDGDGKSEVACKTADGTVDGVGTVIGDANADYRNPYGYILSGPEYLTIFEGLTGKALTTTMYDPPRGATTPDELKAMWGDNYGNRVDRFLAAIAYLDGERPSLVMCRGYYTRAVLVAYNWRDGQLTKVWTFDSNAPGNSGYAGQGNHNLSIADVDGDSCDEIVYGACAVDHNGKGLYITGLGHGDAMHVGDLDPDRPGLEVFQVHESTSSPAGAEFRDARTGKLIFGVRTGKDTGRGLSGDIDPRYKGEEFWAASGVGVRDTKGNQISSSAPSMNFAIWWDGDLLRELLDSNRIDKWDYTNSKSVNLLTADGCSSNNSTKSNPSLSADILGDWREEVIWRTADSSALRIYTTTAVTEHRIYTLMHDPTYRLGIAWQNVAYNQPPHTGFYLGDGMTELPRPRINTVSYISASINPETINMAVDSDNTPITVYMEFPAYQDVSLIDPAAVRMSIGSRTIVPEVLPTEIGDYDGNGIKDLMLKFNRQQVINALAEISNSAVSNSNVNKSGKYIITFNGLLNGGGSFFGSDTIKIMK